MGNKRGLGSFMNVQEFLNLCCLGLWILQFQFFRQDIRVTDIETDMLDISALDYTVMVKNIPLYYDALNNDYDDDLKDFFEKNGMQFDHTEVTSVILCYNMKEVIELQLKK